MRSVVLRYWQLIEHICEPPLDSVELFTRSKSGDIQSNLERPGWREAIEPREGELFAGALSYLAQLNPGEDYSERLFVDVPRAWRELKRRILWPSPGDRDLLAIGARGRDFGRAEAVDALRAATVVGFPEGEPVARGRGRRGAVRIAHRLAGRARRRAARAAVAAKDCAASARSRRGGFLRILHLANHCDRVGNGIMNVAVDLACEQARLGHAVAFASAGGSFEESLEARDVRHFAVSQHWRRPLRLFDGARKLRRLLAEFKPDIVHAHMMGGAVMARAFNAPRRYGLVTTVHNEWQRTSTLMGLGDRVIAVSDATRTAMVARGVRESSSEPCATARSVRRERSPPGPPAPRLNRPAILTVCGLYERKGVGRPDRGLREARRQASVRPSLHCRRRP